MKPAKRTIYTRPPNSVWELALCRQQLAPWPPKFTGGRVFLHMGAED